MANAHREVAAAIVGVDDRPFVGRLNQRGATDLQHGSRYAGVPQMKMAVNHQGRGQTANERLDHGVSVHEPTRVLEPGFAYGGRSRDDRQMAKKKTGASGQPVTSGSRDAPTVRLLVVIGRPAR